MIVPPEPALSTDADAAHHWTARRRLALPLLGVILSIPVSIIMGAVAEIIVALTAMPVALVLTRDWYVTSAALSYGPFAASTSLLWLVIATGLWSVMLALLGAQRRRLVAVAAGVGVVLLGYVLASYLTAIAPVTRARELALAAAWPIGGLAIAVIAGALTGLLSSRYANDCIPPPQNSRDLLMRLIKQLALFAFSLALCLEGSVAVLAALNQF